MRTGSKTAFRLLFAVLLVMWCTSRADAWIRITVNNNRSHAISLAFCWSGFDFGQDERKGWYNVGPGTSRTITLADANSSLTFDSFGYYAKGKTKDGKNVVWSGDMRQVIIHPRKPFAGHPDDPVKGGVTVGFRKIALKKNGNRNMDATATLTFKP